MDLKHQFDEFFKRLPQVATHPVLTAEGSINYQFVGYRPCSFHSFNWRFLYGGIKSNGESFSSSRFIPTSLANVYDPEDRNPDPVELLIKDYGDAIRDSEELINAFVGVNDAIKIEFLKPDRFEVNQEINVYTEGRSTLKRKFRFSSSCWVYFLEEALRNSLECDRLPFDEFELLSDANKMFVANVLAKHPMSTESATKILAWHIHHHIEDDVTHIASKPVKKM